MKEKVQFVHEFWDQGHYLFIAPTSYDEKVITKKWTATSAPVFTQVLEAFRSVDDWSVEPVTAAFHSAETAAGKVDMQLLRVLVSGVAGGPQLFDMLVLLGKEEVLMRLEKGIAARA